MADRIKNVSKSVSRNARYIKSHNNKVNENYSKLQSHRIDESKRYKLQRSQFNKSYNNYRRERFGFFLRLLWVVFLLILFVALFKIARGRENDLTFTGLLEFFSNLNQYDIDLKIPNLSITNDWGLFNGFRDFVNWFAVLFGIIIWLFSCILSVINYLLQFIRFVLV